MISPTSRSTHARSIASLVASAVGMFGCSATTQKAKSVEKVGELAIRADMITGRARPPGVPASSPASPQVLILAFDGVNRDLLYDMLRAGQLPNLATLLGGDQLAHAHLDDRFLANLPSTTMPAWTSIMTGKGAGETGVPNNEFFIRETKTLACPAPVSFVDAVPTLEIYTDGYLDKLIAVPTLYEKIHEQDPAALVWVVMNHVFRGVDRMFLTKRSVMLRAFEGEIERQVEKHLTSKESRKLYEGMDRSAIDNLVSHLKTGAVPDVLTLYLSGTDLYAHVAQEGPDQARRTYLAEVVDPALAPLVSRMRERKMLDDRWVIVTSDHGHTPILHDDAHALGTTDGDAPGILRRTGFHVRPFERHVAASDPFNAVIAYGGAMAFVYLADRSKCPGLGACAWSDPPRYREDVLAAAEGFWRNNTDGSLAPHMKGTLDLVLVRKPRPVVEVDAPFEVYVGDGRTQPIDDYLKEHPHPTYIDAAKRFEELAVGVHGERAGDILLLAHNGDRENIEQRYYFAAPYHSWHGSPSKRDSEIPLIVANPRHDAAKINAWVTPILGDRPYQRKITDLVLGLRAHPPL